MIKADISVGVFCDKTSGVTNYGAYASMLVLIDAWDLLRARITRIKQPCPGAPGSRIQL